MGNLVLKGHISYATKKKYRWVAEFGKNTCEKCAALDGQEFDEDEVPYWPHPNCRCKVEEISVVDELESEMNEYKEEIEQLTLRANELLGDTRVLREQIEKLMSETQSKTLSYLEKRLLWIENDVYELIEKIETLTIDIISKNVIQKIEKEIDEVIKSIREYANEYKNLEAKIIAEKIIVDLFVQAGSPIANDAAALWILASGKFSRGLEYIEQNGEIINKVSDLNNKDLEKIVRNKLKSQINKTEARGIHLNASSTLSKSIANSMDFKKIINQNINKLVFENKNILKESTYLDSTVNNFLAIHGCDILNIHVSNGILYAIVLDTIDYNKNEILVKLPRDLQEADAIENYFILVEIAEPISKYFNL